jgi:hypothetical protein
MIPNNYKTSLLIPQELPEFVRDDVSYSTFITFLEAYYQWLETAYSANGQIQTANTSGEGVTYGAKNLLNYMDVDNTLDDFVSYFLKDFLPYIPEDALTDKRKLLKIAKDFYQAKGTEKSYQFLFRALYNSDAEVFETGDAILRASDGKWIISKSVRINALDPEWLKINNLRIFGEISKSYATVDYASVVGNKTEVFISNIQRLFQSGEFVRVVDNNNLDVYFYNGEVYVQNQGVEIPTGATILRGKIVGLISQIRINPRFRGLFYEPGDPVVIEGGLSPDVENPIGATAVVGQTTQGSVQSLAVTEPSNGYRTFPNSAVTFSGGGGSGATAQVVLIDDSKSANLTLVTSNTLSVVANVVVGDANNVVNYVNFAVPANTNSTLLDALTFFSYVVGPIASVNITNQGGGYSSAPAVGVDSLYTTDFGTNNFRFLGILQPIEITDGGVGYANTDTVTFSGGSGYGAFANVTVNTAGSIISVDYVYENSNTLQSYPLGGLSYSSTDLPNITVVSGTGSNASLFVPGIMGDGAILSPTTDRTGAITTINIINPGEDYVSAPNVSLRVADVAISNVTPSTFPEKGDVLYQGASVNTSSYRASVDSITTISTAFPANTQADIYQLRTYNYTGSYNSLLPIKIDREISNVISTFSYDAQNYYTDPATGNPISIVRYGDGNARANAQFLDGLIVGTGKWLNNDGQLSSLGLVLESLDYNNFTYVLSVERALKTYKDLVLNLVHPSGMQLRGRYLLNSANGFNMQTSNTFQVGFHMDTFAGPSALGRIEIDTNTDQISTNIIRFVNTVTANIGNTVFANDVIEFTANNNLRAYSTITEVDWANNQVYTQDNVFVLFANVAIGSAEASSNVINITSVTGQYDGNFVDPTPANSIIFVNDSVSLNGGPYYTVQQVFSNGNILVANSSFGPIENAYITVNKSANTDAVIVYGVIVPYVYPELLTEDGKILLTESGFTILAG